ncbi:MAG TPA: DUF4396 domain-containing protein [Rhizomicrobium sp.]|nr:DUF4396 domain-containing protein [Rhizomicrobium sp.]
MLDILSWISLGSGFLTAALIALDVRGHPQRMRIMNIVWPVTGLYFPLAGLWFYRTLGKPMAVDQPCRHRQPRWKSTFLSAAHCGSGCVLGDVAGAPIVFASGRLLFGSRLFAEYAVEFALAYAFGIAFQFLAIREMRDSSPADAALDAVKADTLSLIAFEVGMFGWMALVHYLLLPGHPGADTIVFWFMMQIAMVLGFLTTYPANWLLV